MTLNSSQLQKQYLIAIQDHMKTFIDSIYTELYDEMREVFYYHIGLDAPLEKQGKRIRPLLVLICAEGAGADVKNALPAASAIELIHNFSLIHDDIEDGGMQRRGKPTVWKKWGLAQGLNYGDAMFNAAFLALNDLSGMYPQETVYDAYQLLFRTCNALTKGQYLDIRFATDAVVSEETYFRMITGKTAALIACSTEMGALLGGLLPEDRELFRSFGESIGIAFQIYDDWLGIWGSEQQTGKSSIGDLLEHKRTFPILMGLEQSVKFKELFFDETMTQEIARNSASILSEIGVEKKVKEACALWTQRAIFTLDQMKCYSDQKKMLIDIANKLLIRSR